MRILFSLFPSSRPASTTASPFVFARSEFKESRQQTVPSFKSLLQNNNEGIHHSLCSRFILLPISSFKAFRSSLVRLRVESRLSRVIGSVMYLCESWRPRVSNCSIQNCAILSLTPVSVCIAVTVDSTPKAAA